MNTGELLKKTQKTLEETTIKYEQNKKELEKLLSERGVLTASRIVDIEFSDEEKIKVLNKVIDKLRVEIDQAGTPLISALKAKNLSLKAKLEKEEKQRAEGEQGILEEKLNKVSKKLLNSLKEAYELNKSLAVSWDKFDKLTAISGSGMPNMKTIRNSMGMLNLVYLTISKEWDGVSDNSVRKFYSKANLQDTRVLF